MDMAMHSWQVGAGITQAIRSPGSARRRVQITLHTGKDGPDFDLSALASARSNSIHIGPNQDVSNSIQIYTGIPVVRIWPGLN